MSVYKPLDAPAKYTNDDGDFMGWVVRVSGINTTSFLNDIGTIQDDVVELTPAPNLGKNMTYMTGAFFKTAGLAFSAAGAYYSKYNKVYPFAMMTDASKHEPVTFSNIEGSALFSILEDVIDSNNKSKVMEFI